MEYHEDANFFPLLKKGDHQFEVMVETIKRVGLQHKIKTFQGKIIDGRNREKACLEAGVPPEYEEWEGGDTLDFVEVENFGRRDLTDSQRVMIARNLFDARLARRRSTTTKSINRRTEIARIAGVSRSLIDRADRIAKIKPDRVDEIINGGVSVDKVTSEIRKELKQEATQKSPLTPLITTIGVYRRADEAIKLAQQAAALVRELSEYDTDTLNKCKRQVLAVINQWQKVSTMCGEVQPNLKVVGGR